MRHGFAQLFVLDQFARAFHRGQQRAFVVARGRLGGQWHGIDVFGAHGFAIGDGHEVGFVALCLLAVHRQPAGGDQHLAVGAEAVPLHFGHAGRDAIFSRREEHGEEAFDHEVVEFGFRFAEIARYLYRGNDGEVIRHLLVVEDAAVGLDPVLLHHLASMARQACGRAAAGLCQRAHGLAHGADVVLGQVARIGTRVRQRLMPFVQRLRQGQRGFGGKAEAAVGVALQRSEVVQRRRHLRRRFGFLGHRAGLFAAGGHDALRGGFGPEPGLALFRIAFVTLERRVDPAAFVQAGRGHEGGVNFPVIARHESADAFFTLVHDGERWRLHASHGCFEKAAVLAVERRHGPGAVDADQPVGFGA